MKEYRYGVTGKDRKALVTAISEILGTQQKYGGPPKYEFTVGEYTVDRNGTLIGPEDLNLVAWLEERGFTPLTAEVQPETEPSPEVIAEPVEGTAEAETTPEPEAETAETETPSEPGETEPGEAGIAPKQTDPDHLTVEYPLTGITDEVLTNIRKMVAAKEPILKMALHTEELPIFLTQTSLKFPWFTGPFDEDAAHDYTQFIACLCETAKKKKRVTAQPINTDNARFSMRVWLISLGMIGPEYDSVRKRLVKPLSGDSGWRYGKPEKADKTEEPVVEQTPEVPDIVGYYNYDPDSDQ